MSTPTQRPGPQILAVATAFDFLEGAFAKAERARAVGLAMVGVGLVAVAGVGFFGAYQQLTVGSLESQTTTLEESLARSQAELSVLDSAEGISSETIAQHIATQKAAIVAAVGSEWDTVALTQAIMASAPPGVQVTDVAFTDTQQPVGVQISGTATGFGSLPVWTQALAAIPGLENVDVNWSGGEGSVKVEATATLNEQARSARARAQGSGAPPPVGGDTTQEGSGDPSGLEQDPAQGLGPGTDEAQVSDPQDLLGSVQGGNS